MKVFLASVKREKHDLSKSSQVTAATEFKHDDIELKTQENQIPNWLDFFNPKPIKVTIY